MISPEIQHFMNLAQESHSAAKVLIEKGFTGFSAAQSYYTMFYLVEALLLTKGLTFSRHSAVIAAFGREFAKAGLFDVKFHRYLIDAEKRREIGHYGDEIEEITDEQALESFRWAQDFKQAVEEYLSKQ